MVGFESHPAHHRIHPGHFSLRLPRDFDVLFCARDKGMKKSGAVMFKTIKDEGVEMSGEDVESKIRRFKS